MAALSRCSCTKPQNSATAVRRSVRPSIALGSHCHTGAGSLHKSFCSTSSSLGAVNSQVPGARNRFRVVSTCAMAAVESATGEMADIRQGAQIKVGDKIPEGEMLVLDESSSEPKPFKISEFTSGKKVVIFGLPGAYTSVCSSKHVPEYNAKYDELKSKGVDAVACVSVNDPWVMREWAKALNVDVERVHMFADGEGAWTRKIGLLQYMPGLGVRSRRFSLFVDNGVVKIVNLDEPGGKSYKVSGPDGMIQKMVENNIS